MTLFMMVSTQRSGTHLLASFLDSHASIKMYGEEAISEWTYDPDNPNHFYNYWRKKIIADPMAITNRMMLKHARDFFQYLVSQNPASQAVGVDIKYDFLETYAYLNPTLQSLKPKAIHLVRKDTLRLFISFFLMRCDHAGLAAGRLPTALFKPIQRLDQHQVRIDPGNDLVQVLTAFKDRENKYRQYLARQFQTIEVGYEQMLGGKEGEVSILNPEFQARICGFLGVDNPATPLSTGMKKANPAGLEPLISNYQEVRDYLVGTPFDRAKHLSPS